MMSADAVDGSAGVGGGMIFDLFDPMDGGDDFPDNLSISIDNIYKILAEEQPPIPNLMGASENFYQGELASGQVDHAKTFKPKAVQEESRGEQSQWNLESSGCKREMDCDIPFDPEEVFNNFSDNGSFEDFDSENLFGNDLMGGFGDPSESFLNSNINHQLLNHIPEYGIPSGNAKAVEMQSNVIDDFYLTSENENKRGCEQLQGDIYFQSEKKCKPDIKNLSSLCNLQNGGTGTSHYMSTETSSLCGGLNNSNTGSLPVSKVEDGMYISPKMHSHMNCDETLTDEVHEGNTGLLTAMTCHGSNVSTLPRNSLTDVKLVIDQTNSANFNPFLSCGYEKSDRKGYQLLSQNSCRISEVKVEAKEASIDCSFPEVSITDLEASLPDELGIGQSYSEETSLISESSTDSSPIPSSQNFDSGHVDVCGVNASERLLFDPEITMQMKNPKTVTKSERGEQFIVSRHNQHFVHEGGSAVVRKNPLGIKLSMGYDSDVCILDDISDPAFPAGLPIRKKPHSISHCSGYSGSHYTGTGGVRHKPDDDRLSFQRALEDLSQPISEACPPDGVLAVPLLRHQRIALSWMVHKETASIRCTGGILADDQGLGKTISTIALILMERSPSSKSCSVVEKQDDFEALNLDDDDCNHDEVSVMKQSQNSNPCVLSRPDKKENSVRVVKGRPQAGTLVVCPTSVLRQWAEELQNKVTSKANLSFLVYHGSNRTKDPNEVAKYDVVLTTYAIVSMEVPKQPLVDKSDEERGKQEVSSVPDGFLNGKKKKIYNPQNRKASGIMDNALLDSSARPLARVGWFRVVLDEAQSIKNHRTQVARACWGLRAKRRWCLSGTPIQNAIDDLYSYFRFLRFEPLEKYQSFCSTIKIPVNKDPANGYKKLQAVLKMIMLRRTKGTLLDGKPIINLPPKTVSLKKVEFSDEEREFYATLEAESQEQFKEYADAGTVKQNYVNILLMLLRLRQACDHRLLVKGINSISSQNSSLEMAKKLPSDQAICAICNDAPEDSVVTLCGHVFCNQCICEHLTGDENICPSPNCKIQLTVSSIFSRGTLKSSLSDQLGHDCCSDSPGFEMKATPKMCEDSLSSYSSKIKAALDILQSLPKYQGSLKNDSEKSVGGFTGSLVYSSNTDSGRSSVDLNGIEHIELDKCSATEVSEKAIVFSQWTGMLDLLEPPLKASSIQYRRLDGTMSVAARERAVKDFNTLPEVTVMIMSLKAASLGLNMVAACHVLLLDLWWNPTTEDQAIDRAHRIGQTRPVTVSRLTIEHTVEDRILNLQERKREMVANAFGEDDSGTRQTRLTEDDLRYLFMV